MNQEGIYECHGRIQGDYLVFIPKKSVLAEKLVEEAHLVTLAMARIRDQYWIPTLRQFVKRIIKSCYECKRFNIIHYPKSSQRLIPTGRTKQDLPFSVTGTDTQGDLYVKQKEREICC